MRLYGSFLVSYKTCENPLYSFYYNFEIEHDEMICTITILKYSFIFTGRKFPLFSVVSVSAIFSAVISFLRMPRLVWEIQIFG